MTENETAAPKPSCPSMSGNFNAFKPQWRSRGTWGKVVNKKFLKADGGDDWTDVHFVVIRGATSVKMPDGVEVPVGIPFPSIFPGILETIHMCGYEQAMALGWSFASYMASVGGEVEVRAFEYELRYKIETSIFKGKVAA